MHWTAGGHKASAVDKKHYHFLIEGSGKVVPGDHNPEVNRSTSDGLYVAHTRRANTGAIGVTVCAMLGARERPFSAGRYPITDAQADALVGLVADLADTYNIPVTRTTVLTHAEVQPTLGIAQRGKWDIMWLPGMSEPDDPVKVGDELRFRIKSAMNPVAPPAVEVEAPQSLWQRFLSLFGVNQ